MQMYLVQEHLTSSNGIDYFKIFHDKQEGWADYVNKVRKVIDFLDYDYYQEAVNVEKEGEILDMDIFKNEYAEEPHEYTVLMKGDYLSFMEISEGGTARSRP